MSTETNLRDECVRILSELLPALSGAKLSPRADNLAFQASNKLARLGIPAIHRYGTPRDEPKDTERDTERPEPPDINEHLAVWVGAVLEPEEPPTSEAASYVRTVSELDEALGILRREGWTPRAQVLAWGTYNGWPVAPFFGRGWRDSAFYIEGTRDDDKWRFRVSIALALAMELGWRP